MSLSQTRYGLSWLNLSFRACSLSIFILALLSTFRSSLHSRAAWQRFWRYAIRFSFLERSTRGRRLRLRHGDRVFWICLSRLWKNWRRFLRIIKPGTVIAWNRKGFRLYWTWKNRARNGRPMTTHEIRALIRKMSLANPRWGAPRIHGELMKLGIDIGETTVAKYMVRPHRPSSQTWKTFLKNHLQDMVSTDFFVVSTATFRLPFAFLMLSHDRRRIVHFGVTDHPTAEWTTQQSINAFPWNSTPRYLLRDRDGSYGEPFPQSAKAMQI
jgi:putative transposase